MGATAAATAAAAGATAADGYVGTDLARAHASALKFIGTWVDAEEPEPPPATAVGRRRRPARAAVYHKKTSTAPNAYI